MITIKIYSYDKSSNVDVTLDGIEDSQYDAIKKELIERLKQEQAYSAISHAYVFALNLCPNANPSDIWQHVIYRTFMDTGKNEQSWKRASGQGFEEAFVEMYNPRLSSYGIRLVVLTSTSANQALKEMGLLGKIAPSKMDIVAQGNCGTNVPEWKIFGVVHAKTSIAERIKDDAPASRIIIDSGFFSVLATLDSKSFPPPHGNGINYGELGGRTAGREEHGPQPKRDYFEVDGDFNYGYSYNLRTPCSKGITKSGCLIKTMTFNMKQPDNFVTDVVDFWQRSKKILCDEIAETKVIR
jgi:hypothetical protein